MGSNSAFVKTLHSVSDQALYLFTLWIRSHSALGHNLHFFTLCIRSYSAFDPTLFLSNCTQKYWHHILRKDKIWKGYILHRVTLYTWSHSAYSQNLQRDKLCMGWLKIAQNTSECFWNFLTKKGYVCTYVLMNKWTEWHCHFLSCSSQLKLTPQTF